MAGSRRSLVGVDPVDRRGRAAQHARRTCPPRPLVLRAPPRRGTMGEAPRPAGDAPMKRVPIHWFNGPFPPKYHQPRAGIAAPLDSCDVDQAHRAPPLSRGSSTSPAPAERPREPSLQVTSVRGVSNRSTTSSRKPGAKISGSVSYLISRVVRCPLCGFFTRSAVSEGQPHAWWWGKVGAAHVRIGCDGKPIDG